MKGFNRLACRIFWIRVMHWEFWNFHLIYLPVYPIWLFLCLRARSFFFFAASNPTIRNGGFLNESKKETFKLLAPALQPKTIFFNAGEDPQKISDLLYSRQFLYPLIGKPNIGGRGRGVRKLSDPAAVIHYAGNAVMDFHIQEFVPYEKEMGVFYYRIPGELNGKISGLVRKEFLAVTGDGQRPVRELLMRNVRGVLQLRELDRNHPALLKQIPGKGEVITVSPYGNHARGAKFLDDSEQLTPALTSMVDALCRQMPDFYYGRLDIRYRDRQALEAGRDFVIVEVNGAGSEPTHMYDPRHSLFFAWKEIVHHWLLLFKVSRTNHCLGFPYLSYAEGLHMFRENKWYAGQLERMKNLQ